MNALEPFKVDGLSGIIHKGATTHVVVCCHGLYSSKESRKHIEFARHVEKHGRLCVRFDFSGCGESKGILSHSLTDHVDDLSTIIDYIQSQYNTTNIALFGSSFGAMTSIAYATKNPISSIVALATPAHVTFNGVTNDITQEAKNCSHILFMHGINDELVSPEDSKLLYSHAQTPKKILMFQTDHRFSHENERIKAISEGINWIMKYF
jgi:alpha/beta superfamily hydrolase